MEYSPLGTAELRISKIGFGCWAIGGHGYGVVDDGDSIIAIQKALDWGVNLFDTADIYGFGHSENILSRGLGSKRHDVVIATKFGVCWDDAGNTYKNCSSRRVVEALEGSLRRLRIDCIPLYQLHWHDGITPIEETMEALIRCRDAGKIKYIGCTNLSRQLIDSINRIEKLQSVQLLFNLVERRNEKLLHDLFFAERMSTIVYGVLVRGLLSGKYDEKTAFGYNDTRSDDNNFKGKQRDRNLNIVREMTSLETYYNKSTAQIALRWVLDVPFISSVIVGMKTGDQVINNIGAIGWNLNKEHWHDLSMLSARNININMDINGESDHALFK
jgi:aryl-alcohol dehydrogenase-like predicted oxidoreductase